MRVVLTAGFDRAPHAVALAELLARDGVVVAGILVVSVFNVKRLRVYVRQRGSRFIGDAARRLVGRPVALRGAASPLQDFLRQNSINDRSLRRWSRRRKVPYTVVRSINDAKAGSFVMDAQADGVLYGGGGILRTPFIVAAKGRILNAHHGPLPAIRGMNACEWSLLLNEPPAVTIHYIDRGIDTGLVLDVLPLKVSPYATIASLREQCTVTAIEGLRRNVMRLREPIAPSHASREAHKQVYTLAPALYEILERRLALGNHGSTA